MKKKLIIAAAVFCTLIVGLIIMARITGMLQYFSIPTPSNEPNIKIGDRIYSSNLKEPKPYHFIIFTNDLADSLSNMGMETEIQPKAKYLHRLCGVTGDILEMKNGVLYVNNKNFDEKLDLNTAYKITAKAFYLIDEEDLNAGFSTGQMQVITKDSAIVTFNKAMKEKYGSKMTLVPDILPTSSNGCFFWNNKNDAWSVDNFGPLQIPAYCYFVLGDNRHNALDSRYFGFVKKENIKGVALNK